MIELWLNYRDENGEAKRVLVEGEKFSIGRTPDNDLQIPLGNLSRQHAEIQRFADVFIVSDCGSSNGSSLNNENLEKPLSLNNGDKLNLGESVEIEIELVSDKPHSKDGGGAGGSGDATDDDEDEGAAIASSGNASAKGASAASSGGDGVSMGWFILAPFLVVFILLAIGGIILLAGVKEEPEVVQTNNYVYPGNDDENPDLPDNKKKDTPVKIETPTSSPLGGNNSTTPVPTTEPTEVTNPSPKVSGDAEKIEGAANLFLQRIAQNDPRAFLTTKQIAQVAPKISQFKNSAALADNIRTAKKNSAEIQSLAASKDVKPQFLVNAALTKLGNQKGDVVATAREMLDSLANISKPFGNESADENLLVIAAYSNNTSGESLQTTAGVFTKNSPESPRIIRSIWFFKEKGKLTDSQFDFALRFLAIGIITQNPKDFNVQAEALVF